MVENIVRKEEKVVTSIFSFSPNTYSKGFFHGVVKRWDCVICVKQEFTNGTILDWTKMKTLADDNLNVKMTKNTH